VRGQIPYFSIVAMTLSHPQRVLLIQIRRFGDVVLTTPLARDLRRAFPGVTLDWMVGAPAAPLLLHNPDISNLVIYRPEQMRSLATSIRRARYDWVVDVQVHPRTAIISRISGAPVRAGWDARFWGMVYTHRTPRDLQPMYVSRNRQRLLHLLGVSTGSSLPQLHLSPEESAQGVEDAAALGIDAGQPVVGLALGTHDPERNWRIDSFAEAAAELERSGARVVIFSFPGDAELLSSFRSLTDAGTVAEWRGDRRFLALLARCTVFLSPNTGPSHMALALGVPRVTIYGSSDATLWSPGLPTTVAVNNPAVPCLGCGSRPCPVNRDCIRGIQPAQVVSAVLSLIGAASRK
jgi:ADP-heptose:LPS heptosyltransferase